MIALLRRERRLNKDSHRRRCITETEKEIREELEEQYLGLPNIYKTYSIAYGGKLSFLDEVRQSIIARLNAIMNTVGFFEKERVNILSSFEDTVKELLQELAEKRMSYLEFEDNIFSYLNVVIDVILPGQQKRQREIFKSWFSEGLREEISRMKKREEELKREDGPYYKVQEGGEKDGV